MPGVRQRGRIWAAGAAGLALSIGAGVAAGSLAADRIDPRYRESFAPRNWTVRSPRPADQWPAETPVMALTGSPGGGLSYVESPPVFRVETVSKADDWDRQIEAEARRWQRQWDVDARADQARVDAEMQAPRENSSAGEAAPNNVAEPATDTGADPVPGPTA